MNRSKAYLIIKVTFFLTLISAAVCAALYACMSSVDYTASVDMDTLRLVQLEELQAGAPTAVIHTTVGDISVVLYPDEAPNAVANFQALANGGYYNDTYVFRVEQDAFFAGGSKDTAGGQGELPAGASESVEQELSQNLWPMRGALCALETSADTGFFAQFFGKVKHYNGSRFLIVDSIDFTEEVRSQMLEKNPDNPVTKAFLDRGGVPNFSQQITIFGQTYDGFETIDKITSAALTGETDNFRPAEDIKILSVETGTYTPS